MVCDSNNCAIITDKACVTRKKNHEPPTKIITKASLISHSPLLHSTTVMKIMKKKEAKSEPVDVKAKFPVEEIREFLP